MTTFSIIIPTYNEEKNISKCLNSLVIDKNSIYKIIISDDNSTDKTLDIARKFKKKFNHFHIQTNKKNIGVFGNINKSLKYIDTDFVLFLSANDYLIGRYFNYLKNNFKNKLKDIHFISALSYIEKNDNLKPFRSPIISLKDKVIFKEKSISYLIKYGPWFTSPTMIYRVATLKKYGFFNFKLKMYSDLFKAILIISNYNSLFIPKIFGVIKIHSNSLRDRTVNDKLWTASFIKNPLNYFIKREFDFFSKNKNLLQSTIFRIKFSKIFFSFDNKNLIQKLIILSYVIFNRRYELFTLFLSRFLKSLIVFKR